MQTRIFKPSPRNLRFLANRLREDEIVAVPAETVYGLAGNGLSERACARIFAAKERPPHDPLILHLASVTEAPALCYWNETAATLAEAFWPGPLTLILPKRAVVPDIVTSGLPSVALRVPRHAVFHELLMLAQIPLAAPSANPFGYISPTSASHVKDNLAGRIPYIIDGGDCPVGIESTVLDIRDPRKPLILRPGVVTAADLKRCLGNLVGAAGPNKRGGDPAVAPGQLDRHYSPSTPLMIVKKRPRDLDGEEAYIAFSTGDDPQAENLFSLTTDGDGTTAARHLFRLLRHLDGRRFKRIYIQEPPTSSAYREALLDRIQRAAEK